MLQRKIAKYTNYPVKILFKEFLRKNYLNIEMKFAVLHVYPSKEIIFPKQDGKWGKGPKEKVEFRLNDILVRSNGRSIKAGAFEFNQLIERRLRDKLKESQQFVSDFSKYLTDRSKPFETVETLVSNIFPVLRIPKEVYRGDTDLETKSKIYRLLEDIPVKKEKIPRFVLREPDPNIRIALASDIIASKVEKLKDVLPPPTVILCGLPQGVDEYAGSSEKTRGASRPKVSDAETRIMELMEEGQRFLSDFDVGEPPIRRDRYSYDLRRALKWKCMKHNVPIQIIRYHTLSGKKDLEDEATIAWNLSVALYYKADGFPWRLADFDPTTCYVGLSFYKEKLSTKEYLRTSFAQVFTSSGDGLALRGKEAAIDQKFDRQPHLSQDAAFSLLNGCLENYKSTTKHTPSRIVVHKSSRFNEAERAGFEKAGKPYGQITMVTFGDRGIRALRVGKYPPLRGTLIELPDKSYLLYTSGYSPYLSTYPGHRIPAPLEILEIYPKDDPTLVAKEVLSLSKLNYNSARFSSRMPITLEFAGQVKKILSEMPPDAPMQTKYKFYM